MMILYFLSNFKDLSCIYVQRLAIWHATRILSKLLFELFEFGVIVRHGLNELFLEFILHMILLSSCQPQAFLTKEERTAYSIFPCASIAIHDTYCIKYIKIQNT